MVLKLIITATTARLKREKSGDYLKFRGDFFPFLEGDSRAWGRSCGLVSLVCFVSSSVVIVSSSVVTDFS